MELMSEGLQPVFLPLDVDNDDSIVAAQEAVRASFGRLDILINNAGVLLRVGLSNILCTILCLLLWVSTLSSLSVITSCTNVHVHAP